MLFGLPAAALALTLTWPALTPSVTATTPARTTDPAQYYPARAAHMGIEGDAKIHCIINTQGRLIGCVVLSESPQNYGFGAASLAVAEHLFQADPPAADSATDKPFETIVKWRLPANARRAGPRPGS